MTQRALLVAVLSLLLTACMDDQKKQTAQCQLEAARIYPAEARQSDHRRHVVDLCMMAAGYEFSREDKQCGVSLYDDENPRCYRPIDGFKQFFWRIEISI